MDYDFEWDINGQEFYGPEVDWTPLLPGSYTISLNIVSNQSESCSEEFELTIQVTEVPQINISGDSELCPNELSQYMASSNIGTVEFQNGSDELWTSPTEDTVIVAYSTSGCYAEQLFEIEVHELPSIEIVESGVLCEGEQFCFDVISDLDDLTWTLNGSEVDQCLEFFQG